MLMFWRVMDWEMVAKIEVSPVMLNMWVLESMVIVSTLASRSIHSVSLLSYAQSSF